MSEWSSESLMEITVLTIFGIVVVFVLCLVIFLVPNIIVIVVPLVINIMNIFNKVPARVPVGNLAAFNGVMCHIFSWLLVAAGVVFIIGIILLAVSKIVEIFS